MKKLLCITLAAALGLSAVGCISATNDPLTVTEYPGTERDTDVPADVTKYYDFDADIYLCNDVYITNETPTYGKGTLSLSLTDKFELKDYQLLLCLDGCDCTSVFSRALWGYAPAWRLEKFEKFTVGEGWSFETRRYDLTPPEDIKEDMIAQGAPDSLTNPRDYIYLLTLDGTHYAFVHLKGREEFERAENEMQLADEIIKRVKVEFTPDDSVIEEEMYRLVSEYLESEFHRVYDPYYDIKSLTVSGWNRQGLEATFYYKMVHAFYNRDPDTVDYIKKAKESGSPGYQRLYDDYLADKEANYEFKAVLTDEGIELYSNVSPKDVNWQPVKIDDYILGNG